MQVKNIDPRILKASVQLLQDAVPELSPVHLVEALKKYTPGKREWLTEADAAERLHVTDKTIRNWIQDGTLIAHRIGGRILISTDDLAAVIKPLNICEKTAVQGRKKPLDDI